MDKGDIKAGMVLKWEVISPFDVHSLAHYSMATQKKHKNGKGFIVFKYAQITMCIMAFEQVTACFMVHHSYNQVTMLIHVI